MEASALMSISKVLLLPLPLPAAVFFLMMREFAEEQKHGFWPR